MIIMYQSNGIISSVNIGWFALFHLMSAVFPFIFNFINIIFLVVLCRFILLFLFFVCIKVFLPFY